jgi:hypothetical protein
VDLDNDELVNVPLPMGTGNLMGFLENFLSPAAQSIGGVTLVVDGAEVGRLSMPANAIKRIIVSKTPFSAEYKKPGKARVEVLTEDGSRQHFEVNGGVFFNSSALDARNAFADTKPDTDKALFTGGLSGPLVQDRAAFYAEWEFLRDRQSAVVNAQTLTGPFVTTVPTSENLGYGVVRVDVRPHRQLTLSTRYEYAREIQRNEDVGGLRLPSLATDSRDIEHGVRFRANAILSGALVNDLRVTVDRATEREGGPAGGAQVLVRGAFRGGVSQAFTDERATGALLQNTTTYFRGPHTLRIGGRVEANAVDMTDRTNFGGTFEYASLDLYAAGRPSLFRVRQGAPDVGFTVYDSDVFVQDDIVLSPAFTLMLGARYDWQSAIDDHDNVVPRAGFAWTPADGTVIRGGAGLFNERLSDGLLGASLMFDGTRTREVVIAEPLPEDPLASGAGTVVPPSVVQLAPDLVTPRVTQASLGVERRVWEDTFLGVEYLHTRGDHLFRTRDINAPAPGSGQRPDARFLNVGQIESTASLRSNALTLSLTGQLGGDIDLRGQYTYSRSTDDASGPLALPANSYDLRAERGRSDFDIRHRFGLLTAFELPAETTLGAVLWLNSGAPFDITTGFDDNGDTHATDRPAGVRRNSGQGFGYAQLDLRLVKEFEFGPSLDEDPTEPGELDFFVDVFNALNRANYDQVIGVRSSPLFGRATSARQPRTIQFSVKYSF